MVDYGLFFENLEVSSLLVDFRGRVMALNRSARRFLTLDDKNPVFLTPQTLKTMVEEGTEGETFPLVFTAPGDRASLLEPLLLRGRVVAVTPGGEPGYFLTLQPSPVMDGDDDQADKDRDLRRFQNRSGRTPLIWVLDDNYRYISFNEAHRQEMKRVWGVDIQVGMNILDCLSDLRYKRLVVYNYNRALSGENFYTVDELKDSDGNKRYFENILGPCLDENSQLRGLRIQTSEMTDPDEVKDRLQLSIAVQRSLIEGYGSIGICSLDRYYRYRAFNDGYRRFMDDVRDVKIRIGASLLESLPSETLRYEVKEKLDQVFLGEELTEVRSYTGKNGRSYFSENHYVPVISNEGTILGMTIFTRDVTEIKTQEGAIREALREKEILLKEIHYRVKNNLQVISSLLDLQMSGQESPCVQSHLQAVFSRVKTMSVIHDQLYQEKSLGVADVREFVSRILTLLVDLYNMDTRRVSLIEDVDDFTVNLETAIPLGLILNELIINAFRHAFSREREGTLSIILKRKAGDTGRLTIADSCREKWAGKNVCDSFSLGLTLVSSLAEQLGGALEFDFGKGTSVSFSFLIA